MQKKGSSTTPQPTTTSSTHQIKGFNPASYVKPGLSQAEVEEMKASFDLFDTDQGGSVDAKELKAAMVSLGFDSKNSVIFKMITKLDQDGSGKLQFNQWLHLMTYKVTPASSREAIEKIFPLYDSQGTDYISVKCLQQVAENLGLSVPTEELQEMITRADLDGDGLVNRDEFYAILTRPIKE